MNYPLCWESATASFFSFYKWAVEALKIWLEQKKRNLLFNHRKIPPKIKNIRIAKKKNSAYPNRPKYSISATPKSFLYLS